MYMQIIYIVYMKLFLVSVNAHCVNYLHSTWSVKRSSLGRFLTWKQEKEIKNIVQGTNKYNTV